MKRVALILIFVFSHVIVNAQNKSLDNLLIIGNNIGLNSIKRSELKQIFKGSKSTWSNNEQVILVMPSSKSDYAQIFASSILDMSQSALQKYWLSLVFQGRSNPPVFLNSSSDIIRYIEENSGAIGVVRSDVKNINPKLIIEISDR